MLLVLLLLLLPLTNPSTNAAPANVNTRGLTILPATSVLVSPNSAICLVVSPTTSLIGESRVFINQLAVHEKRYPVQAVPLSPLHESVYKGVSTHCSPCLVVNIPALWTKTSVYITHTLETSSRGMLSATTLPRGGSSAPCRRTARLVQAG